MKTIKIASGQGFYGDSSRSATEVAKQKAADYIVNDALAELTLSILQKDKMDNPELGYARDIEVMAKKLYPITLQNGIKVVSNSGGLNPESAAKRLKAALSKQGIENVKIATVGGDNVMNRLNEMQTGGEQLLHLDTKQPFSENTFEITHANVYIGAKGIVDALKDGADIILAGRVADPCLTLGILAYEFGWNVEDDNTQENLDKLAKGITVGHLLECGGQASGGNSYAEWPMDYQVSNLGYPIAEVDENGDAVFSKLESDGGKLTRNTLREQLVYEIHDPSNYITPDVVVDFTETTIVELEPNRVKVTGSKGKSRPEMLKLTMGLNEGFISEQFFFMSWPYAFDKAKMFVKATHEIWSKLPLQMEEHRYQFIGLNGIHESAAPLDEQKANDMNEIGVRLVIKHKDPHVGKIALGAVIPLGLNGPPGLISIPGWGKINRGVLGLWPTLIDRKWIKTEVDMY